MSTRSCSTLIAIFILAALVLSGCGAPATAVPTLPLTLEPTLAPSPTTTPLPAGTVLWTFQAGNSIWSTPVIADGKIFFGSDDQSLYAVDLQTHLQAWKFATGGIIRSRPVVEGGMVYASSDDGVLHAVEAATGTEKWKADLGSANVRTGGAFDVGSGYDYQQASPTLADGVIYIGSGAGGLYAIEAASGKQLWKFDTTSRIRSSAAVVEGKVYVGDGNTNLHALDAKTGTELWTQPGCDLPSPAVANGLVYCGSRGTFEVRAWEASTGKLVWQFPEGHSWVDSSPVIDGDTLYIGSSDKSTLFALDPRTGVEKWNLSTKGYAWCTPTPAGDTVYMGSYSMGIEGTFYAVDAASGEAMWSLVVKGGIVGSAAVQDGIVYFGALDGTLYAVQG
jgi:outer membrane protein assembly factor BamB